MRASRTIRRVVVVAAGAAVLGVAPVLADDPPPAVTVIADIPAISPNHVAGAAFGDGVLWVARASGSLQDRCDHQPARRLHPDAGHAEE